MTYKEAYAHFGMKRKNPRWGWSARTPDENAVALMIWKQDLKYENFIATYNDFIDPYLFQWIDKLGNKDRIENIRFAIDHCGGKFHVITGVCKDLAAPRRETDKNGVYPTNIVMKVVKFDEKTGRISAVQVKD